MAKKTTSNTKIKYTKKKELGVSVHRVSDSSKVLKKSNRQSVIVPRAVKKTIIKTGPQATCADLAVCITNPAVENQLSLWLTTNATILAIQSSIANMSYLDLVDTDNTYVGKDDFIPQVNGASLVLTSIDGVLTGSVTISDILTDISTLQTTALTCADLLNDPCKENILDIVGVMATSGVQNGVEVTYDDMNGVLNFNIAPGCGTFCDAVTACPTIVDHEIRISALETAGSLDCAAVMACAGIAQMRNELDNAFDGVSWTQLTSTLTFNQVDGGTQSVILTGVASDELVKVGAGGTARYLNVNDFTDTGSDIVVKKQHSLTSDAAGLKLVNDSAAPGNLKVYGTDALGVKGWRDDAAATEQVFPGVATLSIICNHNLNAHPAVIVTDATGNLIIPDSVLYSSANTVSIGFLLPFTGQAYIR